MIEKGSSINKMKSRNTHGNAWFNEWTNFLNSSATKTC